MAWAAECRTKLQRYDDWIERLLIAASAADPLEPSYYTMNGSSDAWTVVRLLVPELHASDGTPTWTGYEIAKWFSTHCKASPMIGGIWVSGVMRRRRVEYRHWGGAWSPDIADNGDSKSWAHISVRDDGEPLSSNGETLRSRPNPKQRDLFSCWGLRSMAKLCELDELPPRPVGEGWLAPRPGPTRPS
jgi:hypothetical protein